MEIGPREQPEVSRRRQDKMSKKRTFHSFTGAILAVRPASRRLSNKLRIFIEHLDKTFALCSQFNPPR